MSDLDKATINVMWTVAAENVEEGDRIFDSHVKWMTGHPRDGQAALLSYGISRGRELADPMDPNSAETGNTVFVLTKVYQSPTGVPEHWKQAIETRRDLPAFLAWGAKGKVTTLHSGTVVQALW